MEGPRNRTKLPCERILRPANEQRKYEELYVTQASTSGLGLLTRGLPRCRRALWRQQATPAWSDSSVTGTEWARFPHPRAQAVDHGWNRVMRCVANQKNHQCSLAGRIDAGGDAHALHSGLLHQFREVRRMHHLRAAEFRLGDGVD